MATASADPLLDSLISDFGGNYVFALDLLEQYRTDPASVETSWRDYFDRLSGPGAPAATETAAAARPVAVPQREEPKSPSEVTLVRSDGALPASRERSRALVVPAILPG